jgi:hypothetical protein
MLKSQDVVILLKVHNLRNSDWTYSKFANSLYMSSSEVHAALKRCETSNLYDSSIRKVRKSALLEFLVHGIKYVFPGKPGALSRGIPTAHSANPLKDLLVIDSADTYVWSTPDGNVKGQTITPLYKTVPEAAKNDSELYQMLSLVDAIRVGRVREQRLASQEIENRLAVK